MGLHPVHTKNNIEYLKKIDFKKIKHVGGTSLDWDKNEYKQLAKIKGISFTFQPTYKPESQKEEKSK